MVNVGGAISPFNAWLIMRGSVTLPMRMRAHCASAQGRGRVPGRRPARRLRRLPRAAVAPQHALAARTLDGGFGGMLAFAVRGDRGARRTAFVANLRVITSAVSLGHDESLIVHVSGDSEAEGRGYYPRAEFREWGHLRFSVGSGGPARPGRRPRPRADAAVVPAT